MYFFNYTGRQESDYHKFRIAARFWPVCPTHQRPPGVACRAPPAHEQLPVRSDAVKATSSRPAIGRSYFTKVLVKALTSGPKHDVLIKSGVL